MVLVFMEAQRCHVITCLCVSGCDTVASAWAVFQGGVGLSLLPAGAFMLLQASVAARIWLCGEGTCPSGMLGLPCASFYACLIC